MKKIPVIAIAGPTASGKTALSVSLAKKLGGEIISADSMQVYRGMDIGTAKPTQEEMGGIVHHMIDIIDPDEDFSAAEFSKRAAAAAEDITGRGKIPILCGGTGLYMDSFLKDTDFLENDTSPEVRQRLIKEAEALGADEMHKRLYEVDPVSAQRIHKNNVRRVIRALEFYEMTNIPISHHQEETKKKESRYKPLYLMIDWDRSVLYERINKRADIMIENGLAGEVSGLLEKGYTRELTSMQGIGYKEMIAYLLGELSLSDAAEAIKQGTRRYAKRQLTWFGRNPSMIRLKPENAPTEAAELAIRFIKGA